MVLLLSVMMASAFSGCGSSNSSTSTNVTSTANEHSQSALEDNTVEPEPEKTQEKSGTIGDVKISIEDAEVTKSRDGKKAILVAYNVTNNSDNTMIFTDKLSAEAYQNNTACQQASMENQDRDIENMLTVIESGKTKKIYEAYLLQDDSDVTVRVCKIGQTAQQEQNDTTMITRTFKVK